jgi:hypothetical protein
MAEQEIAQHSKNIIGLVTAKHHPLAHRMREIAIEIVTIVFAVSMSIWLHGLSEHHHQQQEVRSLLIGLREDLKGDIAFLTRMQTSYHQFDDNYAYLASLEAGREPDWKRFNEAYEAIGVNSLLIPNKSRFDGFMMSGKLSNIEDEAILNRILELYQTLLPQIKLSEGGWESNRRNLLAYRDDALTTDDPQDHYRVLTTPKSRRLLKHMATYPQLYQRYQAYIDLSRQIIQAIDDAYPNKISAKGTNSVKTR